MAESGFNPGFQIGREARNDQVQGFGGRIGDSAETDFVFGKDTLVRREAAPFLRAVANQDRKRPPSPFRVAY
jgi:hypothetical protein